MKYYINGTIDHKNLRALIKLGFNGRFINTRERGLKYILYKVSLFAGVDTNQIISTERYRKVVFARQLYCYAARDVTDNSLQCIAELINRDHTTVIYSITAIENQMSIDTVLRDNINFFLKELKDDYIRRVR